MFAIFSFLIATFQSKEIYLQDFQIKSNNTISSNISDQASVHHLFHFSSNIRFITVVFIGGNVLFFTVFIFISFQMISSHLFIGIHFLISNLIEA